MPDPPPCRCSGDPADCPDEQWVMEADGAEWDRETRLWQACVLWRCTQCGRVLRPDD